MRLTPQQFVKRFRALSACPEAVVWIAHAGHADFTTAWRASDAPQWMCWLAVRMLQLSGARAVIACARTVSKHADPKLTDVALDAALAVIDKKATDLNPLRIAAFDAANAALHVRVANGPALMAASYAAHCVAKIAEASTLVDPKAKDAALLKGVGHGADAVTHVMDATSHQAGADPRRLAAVVRAHVDEVAMLKVWDRLPL